MTEKKTLIERIIHRARRSKREQWFSDLGIKVGDTVNVSHLNGLVIPCKVVDFEVDKLWRRFVVAKSLDYGTIGRYRADGRIFGHTIAKAG